MMTSLDADLGRILISFILNLCIEDNGTFLVGGVSFYLMCACIIDILHTFFAHLDNCYFSFGL